MSNPWLCPIAYEGLLGSRPHSVGGIELAPTDIQISLSSKEREESEDRNRVGMGTEFCCGFFLI